MTLTAFAEKNQKLTSAQDARRTPVAGSISRRPARARPSSRLPEMQKVLSPNSSELAPLKGCLAQLVHELEPTLRPVQLYDSLPKDDEFDEFSFTNCLAHLGYKTSTIWTRAKVIDPRLLPCLFIPNDRSSSGGSEPFVISARNSEGIASGNSASAHAAPNPAVERMELEGRAIIVQKQAEWETPLSKESRAHSGCSWFRVLLSRFSGVFWQLALVGVLLNIVALASPLFIMFVYDRVISPHNTDYLPMLTAGVGLAIVIEFALRRLRTRQLSWLTARIHNIVGNAVFKHIVELSPAMLQKVSVTAQVARIKSFESVREFFSGPIFMSVLEIPTVLVAVALLLFFSPALAAIPVVAAICFTGLFFILRHFVSPAVRSAAKEASIAQRFSVELFNQRHEIRMNGLSDTWHQKYREISGRENAVYGHLNFLGSVGEHLGHALTIAVGLAALVVGVELVWSDQISTGMLIASMILIWRSVTPFYSLCSLVPRFEQFRNSVIQINELMDVETEDEKRSACARLPEIKGDVKFENVALRFSSDARPVFTNFTTRVRPGEVLGITGATGSGKSCVLGLLQAIHEPQLGQVCIDGFDVQQLVARDLRRLIGHVPQNPTTYPGSVAEALRSVKPEASDDELWSILEQVELSDYVHSLPGQLGARRRRREGQAHSLEIEHRLSFARVRLQDAKLVLIDDISNAIMRPNGNDLLTQFIDEFRGQKTILFVSQRSDQLRLADRLVGLQFGKPPIVGSFEKVLGAEG